MSASQKNNELWLVSYADLMTLLFGFFALLYSLSEDEVKSIQVENLTTQASMSAESREPLTPAKMQQLFNCQAENRELRVENRELKAQSDVASTKSKSDSENIESIRKAEFVTPCRLCVEFYRFHLPSQVEKALGYPKQQGYTLTYVKKGGPADVYGFKELDIIAEVIGHYSNFQLQDLEFSKFEPFAELTFRLFRDGEFITKKIVLDRYENSTVKIRTDKHPEEEIIPGLYGRKINDLDRIQKYIPFYLDGWFESQSLRREVIIKAIPKSNFDLIKYYDTGYRSYFWRARERL